MLSGPWFESLGSSCKVFSLKGFPFPIQEEMEERAEGDKTSLYVQGTLLHLEGLVAHIQ